MSPWSHPLVVSLAIVITGSVAGGGIVVVFALGAGLCALGAVFSAVVPQRAA